MESSTMHKETLSVSGFTGLQFKGVGKVELTQGDHEELVIEAAPDICARVHSEVRDGVLVIFYESDWMDWSGIRLVGSGPIIFHIMMKEVKSLALSGVGSLNCLQITGESLKVSLSGPGSINIGTVKLSVLTVELSGVGSIDISGFATEHTALLSGAGNYRASQLETLNANVKVSGVGNITVWAKESLTAAISGAGAVEYYGSPKIDQKISGIGMLKYLGNR